MAGIAERERRDDLRSRTIAVLVVLVAFSALLWLLFEIRGLLFMVFVALFLAVAMEPPVHTLEKRGWRRGAATGLVFLSAFVLVVIFIVALTPLMINQVDRLLQGFPGYVEGLTALLEDAFGLELNGSGLDQDLGRLGGVTDWLERNWSNLAGGIVGIGSTVLGGFVFVTTVVLFAFYMVAELPKLQRTVLSFMNQKQQRDALHIWDVAVEKMGGYIYSRLILALIGGALTWGFLTLMNVPFAISLGIWAGVLSQLIPVVGTYLAAILPGLVALSTRGTTTTIWVLVFFVAYQQMENFLISPRITKVTMSIHPAVSIGAIIIGASIMGGIGVILALPMAAIIQAVISTYRHRHEVVPEAAANTPSEVAQE